MFHFNFPTTKIPQGLLLGNWPKLQRNAILKNMSQLNRHQVWISLLAIFPM